MFNLSQPILNMFDVIVLGLGPVGCTAALFLAAAGLKVAAVERDKDVYRLPRAVNLDGEIIRAFQRIGRAGDVDALMQTVRAGDRAGFAGPDREWLFGRDRSAFGSNGWQPVNMFDQPEFEQFLRDEALAHPNIVPFVGYEATGVSDGDMSAILEIKGRDAQTLEAKYLLACDGAASLVRKKLGIQSTNLGYDADWLVVDVIVNDKHTLSNDTVQVCDPDRITTYVCTKDPYRRWEFKMLTGETREEILDTDKVMSLIDPWTPRGTYDIRRTAVYQFHASVADEWRRGNIFIAGDAAHQTPPFLGQGMNTGMRDAINFSWKLPLVVNGVASDELLDTYQLERHAHAHDLVDWAVSIGRLMDHMTEQFAAEREGREPPPDPDLHASGYGQSRRQPPIADGIVMREQVGAEGSTGHLFWQPIVCTAGADETRMDELMGPGFSVVTRRDDSLTIGESSQAILNKLFATKISIDKLTPVKGKFDRLFDTADAAIVRPDRLLFGHTTDNLPLDHLIGELDRQMRITR